MVTAPDAPPGTVKVLENEPEASAVAVATTTPAKEICTGSPAAKLCPTAVRLLPPAPLAVLKAKVAPVTVYAALALTLLVEPVATRVFAPAARCCGSGI